MTTRTGKTAIPTVGASGAGDHVATANPQHDHDNAATDAAITAALKAHEDKFHAPVVEPPVVTPPPAGTTPTLNIDFTAGMDPRLRPEFVAGDPGYGLDSDFLGNLSQSAVVNGVLTITAERKTTPSGRPYASSSLDTYGTFDQLYGTFESRIRYAKGQGVWPAFWLLPKGQKNPYPEVDIFEAYPAPPGAGGGSGYGTVVQTVHYAGEPASLYTAVQPVPDMTLDYHVHKIIWTSAAIVFYVDDKETSRQTTHIPTVPMYPIVTLAMGATGYRVDATTPAKLAMDIDYIRVWA